jgi:hypothetical protein
VEAEEKKLAIYPKGTLPLRRQRRSRYAHLLDEDPTFGDWYQNVVRGSLNTGKSYLLSMGRICDDLHHIQPSTLASMNSPESPNHEMPVDPY